MKHAYSLVMTTVAVVFSGVVAHAQSPTLLNQFSDWAAYTHDGQKGKICYALSKPTKMAPSDRNHGDVYFFVSTRPSDNVREEPSVIVGYPFKDGSNVIIDVDGKQFTMFTKGDGAWIENSADEAQLVGAMKAGRTMTVSGQSQRGTNTNYTYSLSGITAAVKEISQACQ